MNAFIKDEKSKAASEVEDNYLKGCEFDRQLNLITLRSEKRAWWVAGVSVSLSITLVITIYTMLPLKTLVPYVIRVEKTTGFVDVITAYSDNEVIKQDEQVDKYFINQYVMHRERYLYTTRKYDRRLVGLMSSTTVQAQYSNYTDPRKNANAPVAVYKDNAEVTVRIKNISFLERETTTQGVIYPVLIRYTKTIERRGESSHTSHWVATLSYIYDPKLKMNVADRYDNPLGFQVVNYRNDAETEEMK
jgi:type IV secretion system protein VirB8